MPNIQEFYPSTYGAYESAFSRSEESNASGCGIRPLCSQKKWITEWQKKGLISIPHRKEVPNMSCVLTHDAYKACLAAANQPIPPDPDPITELPEDEQEDTNTSSGGTKKTQTAAATAKPINWTMIILIVVLLIVITTATVLIIRAKRSGKI